MDQNSQSNGSVLRMAAATMVGVLCCIAGGSLVFADTNDSYGAVSSQ
jgi:hypothetical protein